MLNKEQVIKVMKESGLPLDQVSFGFGGALVETLEKWIIDFENSLKEQN